jgi:hypothetical protein
VKAAKTPPSVIGFVELVDLPEWRIARMRAKVDTGARSSALHVENIREVGQDRVRFDVRLHRRKIDRRVTVEAEISRRGRVRSSSGLSEWRIFVVTVVRIGPLEQRIELSLVDREKMIFRMLLGRSALSHRFLVDVGKRYLLSKQPLKRPSRSALHPSERGSNAGLERQLDSVLHWERRGSTAPKARAKRKAPG